MTALAELRSQSTLPNGPNGPNGLNGANEMSKGVGENAQSDPGASMASISEGNASFVERKRLAFFCEGERTEPYYLQDFMESYDIPRAFVEFSCGGSPERLAAQAVNRMTPDSDCGEAWIVCDRDSHAVFTKAVETARETPGIHLAASFRCIETWFLLHFPATFLRAFSLALSPDGIVHDRYTRISATAPDTWRFEMLLALNGLPDHYGADKWLTLLKTTANLKGFTYAKNQKDLAKKFSAFLPVAVDACAAMAEKRSSVMCDEVIWSGLPELFIRLLKQRRIEEPLSPLERRRMVAFDLFYSKGMDALREIGARRAFILKALDNWDNWRSSRKTFIDLLAGHTNDEFLENGSEVEAPDAAWLARCAEALGYDQQRLAALHADQVLGSETQVSGTAKEIEVLRQCSRLWRAICGLTHGIGAIEKNALQMLEEATKLSDALPANDKVIAHRVPVQNHSLNLYHGLFPYDTFSNFLPLPENATLLFERGQNSVIRPFEPIDVLDSRLSRLTKSPSKEAQPLPAPPAPAIESNEAAASEEKKLETTVAGERVSNETSNVSSDVSPKETLASPSAGPIFAMPLEEAADSAATLTVDASRAQSRAEAASENKATASRSDDGASHELKESLTGYVAILGQRIAGLQNMLMSFNSSRGISRVQMAFEDRSPLKLLASAEERFGECARFKEIWLVLRDDETSQDEIRTVLDFVAYNPSYRVVRVRNEYDVQLLGFFSHHDMQKMCCTELRKAVVRTADQIVGQLKEQIFSRKGAETMMPEQFDLSKALIQALVSVDASAAWAHRNGMTLRSIKQLESGEIYVCVDMSEDAFLQACHASYKGRLEKLLLKWPKSAMSWDTKYWTLDIDDSNGGSLLVLLSRLMRLSTMPCPKKHVGG